MKKGVIPRSGIDTDARWWGYSHTKGWIFGNKLHLMSSTPTTTAGEIIVPLTADVTTTANVPDNKIYPFNNNNNNNICFLFTIGMPYDSLPWI